MYASTEARRGEMRPLVTRVRRRARNWRMSVPAENSESSGRRSAERSSESFCGGWDAAAFKEEWRKQRCERESSMGRRQRVPSAVKCRQRGCSMELVLVASRVISCSFLGTEGTPSVAMKRVHNELIAKGLRSGRCAGGVHKRLKGKGLEGKSR